MRYEFHVSIQQELQYSFGSITIPDRNAVLFHSTDIYNVNGFNRPNFLFRDFSILTEFDGIRFFNLRITEPMLKLFTALANMAACL